MLDAAEDTDDLPPEVIETRWLGFPGATEEQIVAAEARLGVMLPPSYREFLTVTNGWRQPDAFWVANAGSLWSIEQVEWYSGSLYSGHLQTVLEISDNGDGIYLLNPELISDTGEWEAWFFASWNPGSDTYGSFSKMMQAKYQSWKKYLPHYKGEMTEEEYSAYAQSSNLKNI